MIRHVYGDLMDAKADIICHQVNCQGKMGSGVARQIREHFPEAYHEYMRLWSDRYKAQDGLLGLCQVVEVSRNGRRFYIANLFGQLGYGYDGKQYSDIDAFRKGIKSLSLKARLVGAKTIALPFKIGCGRGGADWNEVYTIIEEGLRGFDVTLFEYKE